MFQHGGHRRVLQFGQFRLGHDAQRQHVDQYQEQQHGHEADHRGLAHVAAFFRPGRKDARAFDADEHPHGDQHHLAHLVHHTAQVRVLQAPDVGGEDVQLEGEQGNQHEQQQRHDLGDRGHQVDERGFLDASQYEEMHGPEQHRGTDHGGRGIPLPEYRKEVAEGAEQQDEVTDVAQPGADPVPPGRRKTHVVAETGLGVGVDPAVQVGLAVGQGLEHEGQGEHADGGDRPTDQDGADIGTGGHVLWQGKDPATNHRTDD
ncbi:hypothetical protein D3C76_1016130 [compost metagenome]